MTTKQVGMEPKRIRWKELRSKLAIPALEAFINGLAKASGFFSVTEQEMIKFQGKAAKSMEEQKFFQYKLVKTEAQEIKSLCQAFKLVLPQVSTRTSSNRFLQ